MTESELQHVAGCISGYAEKTSMTERNQTGVPHQHVQRERKDRVEENLAGDIDVINACHPIRQGYNRDERNAKGENATVHGTCLPKRPCGRSSRTSNIGKKRTKYASSGSSA